MSIWKTLGIIEDDKKPEVKSAVEAKPVAPPTPAPAGDAPPAGGSLDVEAIKALIENAIQGAPGFAPLAQFLAIVADTKDVPGMDEATRFRAAQKLTKTPVADLQTALGTHAAALAQESTHFEDSYVNVAHAEIVSLSEKADAVGVEIESVQAHLNDLLAQKAQLIADATTRNTNLEKAKIDFSQIVKDTAARYAELGVKLTKHLGA